MTTYRPCLTCEQDAAWHRRQIEYLDREIGPRAVDDFEANHPENDDEEREEIRRRRCYCQPFDHSRADHEDALQGAN